MLWWKTGMKKLKLKPRTSLLPPVHSHRSSWPWTSPSSGCRSQPRTAMPSKACYKTLVWCCGRASAPHRMLTAWPYCVRPVPSRRRSPTSRTCACGGSRTTTCTDAPTTPYDSRRICGRSSALSSHTGSEGSLIASTGSIIGVGTDIGGSIRMPAFFNGIFDHKPTRGLVSNKGQYPPARDHSLDACLVAGPMCRYAQDLEPMLAIMPGPRASLLPFNTEGKVPVWRELGCFLLRCSPHTLPALALCLLEWLSPKRGHPALTRVLARADTLRDRLDALLGASNAIFVYPSHPEPAPFHYQPLLKPFNYAYTAIFNVLGYATCQCPVGISPLGVQLVAAFCKDHLCLDGAREVEKAFCGWLQPPTE